MKGKQGNRGAALEGGRGGGAYERDTGRWSAEIVPKLNHT